MQVTYSKLKMHLIVHESQNGISDSKSSSQTIQKFKEVVTMWLTAAHL